MTEKVSKVKPQNNDAISIVYVMTLQEKLEKMFSDLNLHNDSQLRTRMDKEGYVPIDFLLKNRFFGFQLKDFLEETKHSDELEINETQTALRKRSEWQKWVL